MGLGVGAHPLIEGAFQRGSVSVRWVRTFGCLEPERRGVSVRSQAVGG